jgi:succinate dehydrogenase / fumarate reductase flavoprotein subunit
MLVNEAVRAMESISDTYLNCYRDGAGLAKAIEKYGMLEKEVDNARILENDMRYNVEFMGLIALKNRLLCSKLAAVMAEERKESRGLHLRFDYPDIDNQSFWVRLIATKKNDGLELSRRPPISGEMAVPTVHKMPYERYLLETGIGLENL